MWRLTLTTGAKQDIRAIAKYVAQQSGSAETARQLARRLEATCTRLSTRGPMMGRSRPELGEDLRSFVDGNYLIFLRYVGDTLEVVNVIEGHRDLPAMFSSDEDGIDAT